MIYELKNDLIYLCKSIRHFFRALICRDYYTESHGLGMCGKYGTNIFKARLCDYIWCPKRKGAEDEQP